MNIEITGTYKGGFNKSYKDKATGLTVQGDFIVQIEQEIKLADNQIRFDSYDIPVDNEQAKFYQNKKRGNTVKVVCNMYAKAVSAEYATLGISKAK